MYRIIGSDQREYGPVSADQIRQWIAEGRANAQTLARAEGTETLQPLSAFPEFTEALGLGARPGAAPFAAAPLQAGGGREAALQAVKGPVIALRVTAILGLVMVLFGLVSNILSLAGISLFPAHQGDPQFREFEQMMNRFGGTVGIVQNLINAVVGVVVLVGASKMGSLTQYSFAFTASILAMLPCVSPCCFLGLPFGIWALVVLNRPEVKSQFT